MKKGMGIVDILIYLLIGVAVLVFIYFAIIQPMYETGTAVVGKLG